MYLQQTLHLSQEPHATNRTRIKPASARASPQACPLARPIHLSLAIAVQAQQFTPGNILVSRTVYSGHAGTVTVGEILPPGCTSTAAGCAGTSGAINNGVYPYVFNNDKYDSSFGITSPIFLDELTPSGDRIFSLEVPNSLQHGITPQSNQLVTSFSSKSEIALTSLLTPESSPSWATWPRSTPSTSPTPTPPPLLTPPTPSA
jgi:hypothetical protein